jgi:hypothetical protein
MIAARIADCPERRRTDTADTRAKARSQPRKRDSSPPIPFDPLRRDGRSRDGTLTWQVSVDAAGTRAFTAQLRKDGEMQEFRNERVNGG